MAFVVNVVCRNWREDRVIPRFSRYLSFHLGYELTGKPNPGADMYYLSGYFERQMFKEKTNKFSAAYFTHRETHPPNNAKSKLFDGVAQEVDLRVVTASMYALELIPYGDTVQINPPVERAFFTVAEKNKKARLTAGFSGFTYSNRRKGEDLAKGLVGSKAGRSVNWLASGRGWPVATKKYKWSEMASFYQALDILVITATVEGVPMPPLEALSCGVSVVIPRGVGLLDELPEVEGLHRYDKGDLASLLDAFRAAVALRTRIDRGALRDITAPYSVLAWCEQHKQAFERLYYGY